MKQRVIALVSGLFLLAGCALSPQMPSPGATLVLDPEFTASEYRVSEIPPYYYDEHDVHHVIVSLYTVADGVETAVVQDGQPVSRTVVREKLDDPVVFERLKAQTTYRVRCIAYMEDETDPSKMIVISTDDAGSYTDIVVTHDDRPTVETLKVRLKAKPFSGLTEFNLDLIDGEVVGTGKEWVDAGKSGV